MRTATHALGLLGTTMLTKTPTVATVCGTRARLDIGGDFYTAGVPVRLFTPDGELHDEYAFPVQGHRLDFEAAEVARCVTAGLSESPLLPWSETIAVMETMDEVRRQVGCATPASDPSPSTRWFEVNTPGFPGVFTSNRRAQARGRYAARSARCPLTWRLPASQASCQLMRRSRQPARSARRSRRRWAASRGCGSCR